MSRQRVLIVGAFPPPMSNVFGGVVTVCRNLVESSLAERFDLVLVDTTQRSNPPPGVARRALYAMRRAFTYVRALVVSRPDAVILFSSVGASLLEKSVMARIARLGRIPTFIFPQGGRLIEIAVASRVQGLWIRWALRGASHFLCQGPAWRRFAVDVVGFAPERAPVVPNWTATNRLLAIGDARAGRFDGHVVQLLFLGWLEEAKGIFELLQACARLTDRYDFRLVIAGRGRAEEAARRHVAEASLSDRVEFAGWVRGDALERLLADSDVLVLPSWAEGLPNAMIEAMAARLAVVVSAVGNVPAVVNDGREALLIPPKSVDALSAAIARLLEDPGLRADVAARGHAFVKEHYAVEPAIAVLSSAIESAIGPVRAA